MELTKTHLVTTGKTRAECGTPTGHMDKKPNHALTNSISFVTCPDCLDKMEARVKEARKETAVMKIADMINEAVPDIVHRSLNANLCEEDIKALDRINDILISTGLSDDTRKSLLDGRRKSMEENNSDHNKYDDIFTSGSGAGQCDPFKPELWPSDTTRLEGVIGASITDLNEAKYSPTPGYKNLILSKVIDKLERSLNCEKKNNYLSKEYKKLWYDMQLSLEKERQAMWKDADNSISGQLKAAEPTPSPAGIDLATMTIEELHRQKLICEVAVAQMKVKEMKGLTVKDQAIHSSAKEYSMTYEQARNCAGRNDTYVHSESMDTCFTFINGAWMDITGHSVTKTYTQEQFEAFTKEMWKVVQ